MMFSSLDAEGLGGVKLCELTFFFFSISAVRSARSFSWDLRFFKRVSGTRMSFLVGTLL
jgi:hypothetical protein